MVVAQLRTAVRVREHVHAVEPLGAVLLFERIGNQLGLAVHAAYGGYYPQFVAYAHVAVSPFIYVYLSGRDLFYGALHLVVGIFEVFRKVGVHVVRVHVAALGDIGGGISYVRAVFYYLFALLYVA